MQSLEPAATQRSYFGWWIVATSAIGMSTGPGQFAYGALGLFMIPFGQEFGWTRTEISFALTCHSVALALANPLCGAVIDRVGTRRVLLPSIVVFAVLLALIPLLVDRLWILLLLFAAIGSLGTGAHLPDIALQQRVHMRLSQQCRVVADGAAFEPG